MPNHTENNLTITGNAKQLKTFVEKHIKKDDEGNDFLDFTTITPCPKELYETRSPSYSEDDIKRIEESDLSPKTKKARIKEIVEVIRLQKRNKKRYGTSNWYDFCVNNWGTKWNSYWGHIYIEDKNKFAMGFSTAWSPPVPIIQKLARLYPKLRFEGNCLDEGWGYAGRYVCENDKYDEHFVDGADDIAQFCNEYMGRNLIYCEKHDHWYDDDDECWECNEEEE